VAVEYWTKLKEGTYSEIEVMAVVTVHSPAIRVAYIYCATFPSTTESAEIDLLELLV
jgi:hypothetical protein